MRAVLAASLVLGCAQGRTAFDPPDAGTADAKVWRDGSIEGQPDAQTVTPPDAFVPDAFVQPEPVCTDRQLLENPVLDLNPVGTDWVEQPNDTGAPLVTADDGVVEHSPPYKAWLGGFEALEYDESYVTDTLYQDFAIPANTMQLRITGYYEVRTGETGTVAYDTAQFALTATDGTPLHVIANLSNLTPTAAWTLIDQVVPQPMAGQTVRLRITSTNDVIYPTSFYFDTLAVTATVCE